MDILYNKLVIVKPFLTYEPPAVIMDSQHTARSHLNLPHKDAWSGQVKWLTGLEKLSKISAIWGPITLFFGAKIAFFAKRTREHGATFDPFDRLRTGKLRTG